MSGLSRTPGKRVWDNIPTGVRIPAPPPNQVVNATSQNLTRLNKTRKDTFFDISGSVLAPFKIPITVT